MRNKFHAFAKILQVGALALALSVPGTTAQINGSVQSQDGKPISGALVIINIRPTGPGTQPFSNTVQAGADGTFTATGIPAGSFVVCPTAPATDYISPCAWEGTAPNATVTANQSLTLPPFKLKLGVHLKLRIDDPTGQQGAMEGSTPGASLLVGVNPLNGLMVPSIAVKNGNGKDHDILIPFDTALELRIFSKTFAIADGNGAKIDPTTGAVVSINVPSGKAPPQLKFTVTGVNP